MKLLTLKKDAKKGFALLDGINRPISPNQVTKLAKSLSKMGCIRPLVVAKISFLTGKDEMYIIDGQHLFYALTRNNMDYPYVEVNISSKEELVENIALLNASSRSWKMEDYITSWGSIHENYKKLRNYFNTYDFDVSVLASILSNGGGITGSQINKKIKNGEFEICDEQKNVKILDNLTDVLKVAPRMDRFQNKYLCTEYISFIKTKGSEYNHKVFLQKLDKKKKELVLSTQESGKLCKIFETL